MLDMLSRKAGAVAARAVARVPRFGIYFRKYKYSSGYVFYKSGFI